jgi:hypothetical protein
MQIYTLDHPPPHVHVAKTGAFVKAGSLHTCADAGRRACAGSVCRRGSALRRRSGHRLSLIPRWWIDDDPQRGLEYSSAPALGPAGPSMIDRGVLEVSA